MIIMLRDPRNPHNLIVSPLYCSILQPVCPIERRVKILGSLTHYFDVISQCSVPGKLYLVFCFVRQNRFHPLCLIYKQLWGRWYLAGRVGLTTMWIYPIIESIACYFMILDFVPSPVQTTLISHKNTILRPQVENFMSFFRTTVRRDFPEISEDIFNNWRDCGLSLVYWGW